MSSITWTPHAVATSATLRAITTNATLRSRRLWRAVEAQHLASTRRLVATLAEQQQLEEILESTKPPFSAEARDLHYLLATPFRYPRVEGSRFRAPDDAGVFYGADTPRTACAELGYWRWRFLMDSPRLATLGPAQQTLFEAGVKTLSVDLLRPPFAREAKRWEAPDDYRATQGFGKLAREAGVGLIVYRSVRDPEPGLCGAVLRPDAFRPKKPTAPTQTWLLTVTREHATWQRERQALEFDMRRWRKK